jgi:hypothetical protein
MKLTPLAWTTAVLCSTLSACSNELPRVWSGTFTDGQVQLSLSGAAESLTGSLLFNQQLFPARAIADGNELTGTFQHKGHPFDFSAQWQGEALVFDTGGKSFRLGRAALSGPSIAPNPVAMAPQPHAGQPLAAPPGHVNNVATNHPQMQNRAYLGAGQQAIAQPMPQGGIVQGAGTALQEVEVDLIDAITEMASWFGYVEEPAAAYPSGYGQPGTVYQGQGQPAPYTGGPTLVSPGVPMVDPAQYTDPNSSYYDPYEVDSEGWSGGAYENPSSSYYDSSYDSSYDTSFSSFDSGSYDY